MKLQVCILLIAFTIQSTIARERIFVENGILMMKELSIRSPENENKLDHPHDAEVWMESVNIAMLSANMLSRLSNATKLNVRDGVLSTVEIPVRLENIDLESCHTNKILIDSGRGDYKLKVLYVHHNRLQKIPQNLNSLKHLKELVLNDNEIESVDLNSFQGLTELRVIALQRNNITSISSRQHKLIPLVDFYLDQNHLTELSFSSLLAESVTTIHFDENRLTMVLGLTSAFPALTTIRLHGNPLDCAWTKYVLEELQSRNVTVADLREGTCLNGTTVERLVPEEKPKLRSVLEARAYRIRGRVFRD
ncbi:uncharacterized protein LOC120422659 [Culex pipiens pallens]|uniref:uncharacterized protein LOC120422659 n=1 Tax=Culex pipiens pallens TaxID=42434 RepID=UPI0022AB41F8|nr:uncharacterized protein LOC120422659 [Culex pipiens pallens]